MMLKLELPLHLKSVANLREHWAAKAKRVKSNREAVVWARKTFAARAFDECIAAVMRGEKLEVKLTRVAPRRLDSDNCVSAFKAVRDQVAAELGIDDGSDAVLWVYDQASGNSLVRIEIDRLSLAVVEAAS